ACCLQSADHTLSPGRIGDRFTTPQARQSDAAQRAFTRRPRGGAHLSQEPAVMTEAERLEQTWYVPRGIVGWFSVADHRTIGPRYLVSAFRVFIFARILVGVVRVELAVAYYAFG